MKKRFDYKSYSDSRDYTIDWAATVLRIQKKIDSGEATATEMAEAPSKLEKILAEGIQSLTEELRMVKLRLKEKEKFEGEEDD